ncbi:hypothetical protein [Bacillus cereus]
MLTFEEIEQQIDVVLLEEFKKQSTKKVFSHSELTLVQKTKHGKRYKSTNIYTYEVHKEEYKKLVREHYMQLQKEQQKKDSKKRKKEKGKNITQREFFELIFRDHFDHRKGEKDKKGRRIYLKSFLFNINKETKIIDEKTVVRSSDKAIEKAKKFNYFTPNMFISHKFFSKEMLSLLGVIVLDFDLDKVGVVMTKEELRDYIKKKLKQEPTMIWDTTTPGNYQACFLIKPMVARPKSVHLYEQVVKEMIYTLGEVCDEAPFEANHIFSIGRNSNRTNRHIRFYNNKEHDIKQSFKWLLNERDKRREKNQPVVDFKVESFRRHPAIKALFNGEVRWRNHACFTLALVLRFLGKDELEAETFITCEWLPKVNTIEYDHVFTEREAQHCTKHAYSGNYRNFHSKWIETVTGIECNLRGYFRFVPYVAKGIYNTDTKDRFMEFMEKNNNVYVGTQSEIAEMLNVKVETLKKIMQTMRKDNELDYPTVRGKGKQTTFTLVEESKQEEMIPIIDLEPYTNIEEQLEAIEELEGIMECMA